MMAAIPTPQKGGKHLQYLTTEVTRFIVHTQHREIAIRTDRDPSILALTDAIKRTCRNLDIIVHDEGAPVGDHQSNGAAQRSQYRFCEQRQDFWSNRLKIDWQEAK